jgi:hypothetical protein
LRELFQRFPQVAEANTARPMDAAGECLVYDEYELNNIVLPSTHCHALQISFLGEVIS